MRRRTFFGMVGAGAAAAAVPGALRAGTSTTGAATPRDEARASGPNLDFLLGPLVGRTLTGGLRVAAASAITQGAVTLTLRGRDGREAVVQAFRRSASSAGIATTRWLDLRWMNGADGELATPEAGGLAVMSLASRIRRIESALVRDGVTGAQRSALRSLETIEARNARYGARYGAAVDGAGSVEQA
jgi:hypothetical protein